MLLGNQKMRTWVIAAIGSSVIGIGAYAAAPSIAAGIAGVHSPQPTELKSKKEDVKEALMHLREARNLLREVDENEKGHDYQALAHTKEAIQECEEFLK